MRRPLLNKHKKQVVKVNLDDETSCYDDILSQCNYIGAYSQLNSPKNVSFFDKSNFFAKARNS